MATTVDGVPEAREALAQEARSAGLEVIRLEGEPDSHYLEVGAEGPEDVLRQARALGARAVYLFEPLPYPLAAAGTVRRLADTAPESKWASTTEEAQELAGSLRRLASLMEAGRPFDLLTGYLHGGTFHRIRLVDRGAWMGLGAFEELLEHVVEGHHEAGRPSGGLPGGSNGEEEEEDEEEDEEEGEEEGEEEEEGEQPAKVLDPGSADPRDVAHAIVRALLAGGASRRELRRDSAHFVREAIRDLYGPPDGLKEGAARANLREARRIAEKRLRKGDF